MSYDIKVEKVCDHRICEDLVFVQSDYRTLQVNRDIAVTNSLVVKRDGYELDPDSTPYGFSVVDVQFESNPLNPFLNPNLPITKAVVFNQRMKSADDFYELSYVTYLEDCPKCNGTGFYFDWAVDELGQLVKIYDENKLIQDVVKGTYTIKGSNPFYLWYGTYFEALIGSKMTGFEQLKLVIAQDVNNFFNNLKDLQNQQARFQQVSDRERIQSLISVAVNMPNASDPTLVEVSIIFRNKAGNIKEIKRVVNDSGTVQLFSGVQQKLRLI